MCSRFVLLKMFFILLFLFLFFEVRACAICAADLDRTVQCPSKKAKVDVKILPQPEG